MAKALAVHLRPGQDFPGRVVDEDGSSISGAALRLTSDLATLGSDPRAVSNSRGAVTWTRPLTGFSGSLWNCWQKYVAREVAGITWEEFRREAAQYNPALRDSDEVMAGGVRYFLPENRVNRAPAGAAPDVVWDRELADFDGDLWACWRRNLQGKVIGLTWEAFRREVREHNPGLLLRDEASGAKQNIVLPRNPNQDEYSRITYTDADGRFWIEDLPEGSYRLETVAPGYMPDTRTISVPVVGKVLIALSAPLVIEARGEDFVRTVGRDFSIGGRRFRFIGVNLRGLAHYGQQPGLPAADARQQLRAARDMGARVVRVFVPHKDVSSGDTVNRLRNLLNLMQAEFADMYLILSLCNLYSDVDFRVPGDGDGAYSLQPGGSGAHILGLDWFREGYKGAYSQFARTIVTAFQDHPRIMAYNVGNELKAEGAPDLLVGFMLAMAAQIRSWDRNHLITTGMISTRHAYMAGNDALRMRLYSSPNIDFITNHAYHGDQNDAPSPEDDSDLSIRLNKPLVIEEAGFVGTGDRSGWYENDMRILLDEKRASGFMPWGFMAGWDNGDGDTALGIDHIWHNADWGRLNDMFRGRAASLASDNAMLERPKPVTSFTVGQTVWTQTSVNMRKTPGVAGQRVKLLPARTQLLITGDGESRDGLLWWPVSVQNLSGYVAQADRANVPLLSAA